MSPSANHWMMFGTFGEQRYFVYPDKNAYHGVVVNCNMAAYAPDGIASFVLSKTYEQRYLLDPQTHAFQHDPTHVRNTDGTLKKSIEKLATAYGGLIAERAGKRPVFPSMFAPGSRALAELVENCLTFQEHQIADRIRESDDRKYMAFEESGEKDLGPYCLVAPYFYMDETTLDEWLPVNRSAVEIALKSGRQQVFAAVVVSQGVLLDEPLRVRIVDAFRGLKIRGLLLWVDDLDEAEAGGAELTGLLALAKGLRGPAGEREVINLHGGFLSVLASGDQWGEAAFSGVCHGPEFGEHRSVIPVGGGVPIARYYVPHLHRRVRYREAVAMFNELGYLKDAETFFERVCGCRACRATLEGEANNFARFGESTVKLVGYPTGMQRREYPTGEAKLRCLEHYLEKKQVEYNMALTASPGQIQQELDMGERYKDAVGLDGISHLKLWKDVLSTELARAPSQD